MLRIPARIACDGGHGARVPRRPPTRQNGAVTTPADRTARATGGCSPRSLIALAAVPVVLRYLVFWPLDQWQVDVEVYREAGVSILTGRPVYAALTEAPQLLPFTYPPFAAVLAIPLAMMPFGAAGWLWTGLQVLATTAIVWYAGYRLIHRAGAWVPLALAALTAPMLWLHPVSDGIRFGQVNAFMVLACLMDLREPRPGARAAGAPGRARRARDGRQADARASSSCTSWSPSGGRRRRRRSAPRWRSRSGVWVLLPQASFAFWGGALQDPARLGPEHGHLEPVDPRVPAAGRARGHCRARCIWLVCVAVVGVFGFWLARRLYLAGDSIGEVAAVGLMACLLSPGGVDPPLPLGRRRGLRAARRRPAARPPPALGGARRHRVLPLPAARGGASRGSTTASGPSCPGRVLQNADVFGALAALVLLWWVTRPRPERRDDAEPRPTATAVRARRRSPARCRRRAAGRRRRRCAAASTAASR